MTPILAARAISKRFGPVAALSNVSFDLLPGELHALCGENGAGKSTLIKILSGIHPAGSYEGVIEIDGQPVRFASVRDADAAGIGVIVQELAIVPELSVAANLFLGCEPRRGRWAVDHLLMARQAREWMQRVGWDGPVTRPAGELGVGERQLIEIARALSRAKRILILDEPTAALAERETERLFALLKDLQQLGLGLIYISHRLEEVRALAQRVTVLRDGQTVATFPRDQASRETLLKAMVGRAMSEVFPQRPPPADEPLLHVHNLSLADRPRAPLRLEDLTFHVRSGEILGLGGMVGAGRSELLLHLVGAWGHRVTGSVALDAEPFQPRHPAQALHRGVGLVPEDRRAQALVLDQSVRFNLALAAPSDIANRWGGIDSARDHQLADHWRTHLHIKGDPTIPVGRLSGGNQQKVVLGKTLRCNPRLLLLDEPTRGIDVAARTEIYQILSNWLRPGRAILLASSDLEELLGLSDRILVLRNRRIAATFDRSAATPESIVHSAAG